MKHWKYCQSKKANNSKIKCTVTKNFCEINFIWHNKLERKLSCFHEIFFKWKKISRFSIILLTEKNFRQINSYALVKTLLSRNFCEKSVRVNFWNILTVLFWQLRQIHFLLEQFDEFYRCPYRICNKLVILLNENRRINKNFTTFTEIVQNWRVCVGFNSNTSTLAVKNVLKNWN